MPWGKVLGLIAGASVSYFFILPANVLPNLGVAEMSLGDLLSILAVVIGRVADAL